MLSPPGNPVANILRNHRAVSVKELAFPALPSCTRPIPPLRLRLAFPSPWGSCEVVAGIWSAPPVDHSPVRTCVPCLPCFLSCPHGARHTVLAQPWFPLDTRPPGTWSGPVFSVTWVVILTLHSWSPPHPLTHSLCLGPSVALWMEAVKGV